MDQIQNQINEKIERARAQFEQFNNFLEQADTEERFCLTQFQIMFILGAFFVLLLVYFFTLICVW